MKSVRDIPVLHNIPVLVRAALNVPIEHAEVADPFRLTHALPTIQFLQKAGAKVILVGHLGEAGTETLMPVYEAMRAHVSNLSFCPTSVGADARASARALNPGDVLMLENLRRNKGETANDEEFAKELASLADVFVEDAFDVCHRAHASVVGVPKLLPSYAGLLLQKEIEELGKALKPVRPSLAVIGGAKFSTKEPVLKKLLELYDHVFVGGALANDFMKSAGKPVGKSFVSGADVSAIAGNPRLVLPQDYIVAPVGAARDAGRVAGLDEVGADDVISDAGPATSLMLAELAANAETILWNGPLGAYEHGFVDATNALARAMASAKGRTIVGGGDTVAAIENLHLNDRFSFLSTGGGAMLEFLAKGTLPGLEALG